LISASGAITTEYLTGSSVSPDLAAMLARTNVTGGNVPVGIGQQTANSLHMLMSRTTNSLTGVHGAAVDGGDIAVGGAVQTPFNLSTLAKLSPALGVSVPGRI
jgi:hypothetical protein